MVTSICAAELLCLGIIFSSQLSTSLFRHHVSFPVWCQTVSHTSSIVWWLLVVSTPHKVIQLCLVDGAIGLRIAAQFGTGIPGSRHIGFTLENLLTEPGRRGPCLSCLRLGPLVLCLTPKKDQMERKYGLEGETNILCGGIWDKSFTSKCRLQCRNISQSAAEFPALNRLIMKHWKRTHYRRWFMALTLRLLNSGSSTSIWDHRVWVC